MRPSSRATFPPLWCCVPCDVRESHFSDVGAWSADLKEDTPSHYRELSDALTDTTVVRRHPPGRRCCVCCVTGGRVTSVRSVYGWPIRRMTPLSTTERRYNRHNRCQTTSPRETVWCVLCDGRQSLVAHRQRATVRDRHMQFAVIIRPPVNLSSSLELQLFNYHYILCVRLCELKTRTTHFP